MPSALTADRFRKLHWVLLIVSLYGIMISVRVIMSVFEPLTPPELVGSRLLNYSLMFFGWCLVAWMAHLGTQRSLAPREWLILLTALFPSVVSTL